MRDEEFAALRAQIVTWRHQRVDSPFGVIPGSIVQLRARIADSIDNEEKRTLYSWLLSECSRAQNRAVMMATLHEQLSTLPNDILAHTGMAYALASDGCNDDAIFVLLRRAVVLAMSQNTLLRYALNCQARIALQCLNAPAFDESIGHMLKDAHTVREQDLGLEFDFLDAIPAGFGDQEQLARYRSLAT